MAAETSVVANEGGFAAGREQTINFAPSPELVAALTRPLEQLNEYQRKEIKDLRNRTPRKTAGSRAIRLIHCGCGGREAGDGGAAWVL